MHARDAPLGHSHRRTFRHVTCAASSCYAVASDRAQPGAGGRSSGSREGWPNHPGEMFAAARRWPGSQPANHKSLARRRPAHVETLGQRCRLQVALPKPRHGARRDQPPARTFGCGRLDRTRPAGRLRRVDSTQPHLGCGRRKHPMTDISRMLPYVALAPASPRGCGLRACEPFISRCPASQLARNHATVRRRPSSNSVAAWNQISRAARLVSSTRRGCPSGLLASQRISPVKSVACATSATSSRIKISRPTPILRGSGLL